MFSFKKFFLFLFILIVSIIPSYGESVILVEKTDSYYIAYDTLYEYGSKISEPLNLFIKALSKDKITILINEKYDKEVENLDGRKIIRESLDLEKIPQSKENRIYAGIDRVYPISDLNRIMFIADELNDKGINFFCVLMPIYDNLDTVAFERYLKVLDYLKDRGANFVINFPVINEEGSYNGDYKSALMKAKEIFNKNGVELVGMKLSQDQLFNEVVLVSAMELPILLVEDQIRRVDEDIDIKLVSTYINHFKILPVKPFKYMQSYDGLNRNHDFAEGVWMIDSNKDLDNFDEFSEALPHTSHWISLIQPKLFEEALEKDLMVEKFVLNSEENTKFEKFIDDELLKIKGYTYVSKDNDLKEYNISTFVKWTLRVAAIIVLILGIQVLIGRKQNRKKFFKD